jgi:hypothetical protein
VALTRILATAAETITKTIVVDEAVTDAAGAVTVTVARLDGTAVVSGAATHTGQGVYAYALPASAVLDTWTVDWAGSFGGSTVRLRDHVEHVGGFLFGLGEARTELRIPATVSTATLAGRRTEVEQECEDICRRAWVPRFRRIAVDGQGLTALVVPDLYVRAVRAVTVYDWTNTPTVLTAADLAAIRPSPEGVLYRADGQCWPYGNQNVVVEYEHGADYPPADITSMAKIRLQAMLGRSSSGIPARALSFTVTDGGTYRLAMPTAKDTGMPDVDAVYHRHGEPRVWIA